MEKNTDLIAKKDVALGDRVNMAFMNTNVTRGHGEILVTTTGDDSEVGHIATMLGEQKTEKSPLTKQIDHITLIIIGLAGIAFLQHRGNRSHPGRVIYDTIHYRDITCDRFNSRCIASSRHHDSFHRHRCHGKEKCHNKIPCPLFETLGSTSAINSDKTGTLTMNQMTVRTISTVKHRYMVTGEGYSFEGKIQRTQGDPEENLDFILFPCALCIDTDVKDGQVIGDPTEAALISFSQRKAG